MPSFVKRDHLLAQQSQERSSTHTNIKNLSLQRFSPALGQHYNGQRSSLKKTSAIPGDRADPPIQLASRMRHFVFSCVGTPPGTDKATEQ